MKEVKLPSGKKIRIRKNEKLVYKVVRLDTNVFYSMFMNQKKYKLEYFLGKRTTAKHGKIFAFSTLKEAQNAEFGKKPYTILLCKAINPLKIRYRPQCFGFDIVEAFQKYCRKFGYIKLSKHNGNTIRIAKNEYLNNVNDGTMLCASVLPLEVVR